MALFGLLSQPLYILHTTFKKLHVNFSLPKHKNNPLIRTKKKKVFNMHEGAYQAAPPEKSICGFKSI